MNRSLIKWLIAALAWLVLSTAMAQSDTAATDAQQATSAPADSAQAQTIRRLLTIKQALEDKRERVRALLEQLDTADQIDQQRIHAQIAELRDGEISSRRVQAKDFGLKPASLEDLGVSSPEESAERIRAVLAGKTGPDRDIVLLNAAAALTVAGMVDGIADGLAPAEEAVASGAASAALDKLIEISNAG